MKLKIKKRTDQGVALVTALVVVAVVFMLIMSTLYIITSSATMSGAGKRYATAAEAADGSVEIGKNAIDRILRMESAPAVVTTGDCDGQEYDLPTALLTLNSPCTKTLILPDTMGSNYAATLTIEYLFTSAMAGGTIKFPPKLVGGMGSVAVYYKITTVVRDTNNKTSAENSVLYRFTG